MATNPMQRKSRNSFLLGVVITLVIATVIVVLLYMQLKKTNEQLKKEMDSKESVYVLTQEVKSGQTITADMFSLIQVSNAGVPEDAHNTNINEWLRNYALSDKEGNTISTKPDGTLSMKINNEEVVVYKEENTDSYYYIPNGTNNKVYIELSEKPLVAKVNLKSKTVLTSSLIARIDEVKADDVRTQEYNMVVLPTDLQPGEYVDIRLMLPTGQDYIVVSKKAVSIPDIEGEYLPDTILMDLSEDEILSMSSAIVEAFMMDGSKLYATKYAEAGRQNPASPTYLAKAEVTQLMNSDPNIVDKAKAALRERYANGGLTTMRNDYINSAVEQYGKPENIDDKMEDSIQLTQENREDYLDSLL